MPIGEVPITSYFSRAPQKKRKKASGSHSGQSTPPTKRKRVEEPDVVPAVKKEQKQASLPFPKASRKTAPSRTPLVPPRSHSTVGSDPPAPSDRPTSPFSHTATRLSPTTNTHVSPVASGDSNNPPSSPRKSHSPPASPRNSVATKKSVAFASSPALQSYEPNSPKNNWSEVVNDDDSDALFIVPSSQSQYITTPYRPSSSPPERFDDVPSSQSQYFLPSESPLLRNELSSIDFVPSSQSQYFPPTSEPVPPELFQRDDDGFVVPSSQSQRLTPMEEAEDLRSSLEVPDGADEEIIPSSQSQLELELIPRREYGLSGRASDELNISSPESSQPAVLSDRDVADMFEDPLSITTAAPKKDVDDSATESDDDVAPVLPRPSSPVQPPPLELEEYSLQSGFGAYTAQSLPDDGLSAESPGSSLGSMPSAVKEFYDMVGSGDGSYPSSFPESLRGQWTQDD
ncbi:hypothetical protein B0H19DRAFT_1176912 [Mycena capillaripes]|nr:hypothetical protein B0H19DRAFT_1176912 [Mycena capillaripes]